MSADLGELPGTVVELEALAEARVDKLAWDYIAHGSGDEITMRDNIAAWERLRLRPHVLRDMSDVQTTTSVLGTTIDLPVLIAPTAMHRFYCDEGESATARAAARAGTVMVVSMAATTSLEDVAPRRRTPRTGRRCTCCATAASHARSRSVHVTPGTER